MGKVERGMQAPANAVYFSIFYCGCKQLKSIHLEIRLQRYEFLNKMQNYFQIPEMPRSFYSFLCRKWRLPSRAASQKVSKIIINDWLITVSS